MINFPENTPPLLSIKQAVPLAHICRTIMCDMIKDKRIQSIKRGKSRLIITASLLEYLNGLVKD